MIQLDLRIFSKWVGSTTRYKSPLLQNGVKIHVVIFQSQTFIGWLTPGSTAPATWVRWKSTILVTLVPSNVKGWRVRRKKTDGSLVHESIDAYRCTVLAKRNLLGFAARGFWFSKCPHRMLLGLERFSVCMVRYRALSVHLNFSTNLIICTHTVQNILTYLYTTHGKWNIEKCCFGKDSSFKSGWTFGISSGAIPSSFFRPFQRDNAKPLRPGVFCQPFS